MRCHRRLLNFALPVCIRVKLLLQRQFDTIYQPRSLIANRLCARYRLEAARYFQITRVNNDYHRTFSKVRNFQAVKSWQIVVIDKIMAQVINTGIPEQIQLWAIVCVEPTARRCRSGRAHFGARRYLISCRILRTNLQRELVNVQGPLNEKPE